MEDILRKLLQSDSATIKEGTKELKQMLKSPETIWRLCETLCTTGEVDIKQYAAIVLKRRFSQVKHWTALNVNARNQVKSILMERLVIEPEKSVKNSIVQVMGIIVKHENPSTSWPELFQFIQQTTTSTVMNERELGFYTLNILLDSALAQFLPHIASFVTLFSSTLSSLQDPASPVGYFVILSMTSFLPAVRDNKELTDKYLEMVPRIVVCIKALGAKRPDRASEAMDFFYELAEGRDGGTSQKNPFLAPKTFRLMTKMALEFVQEKSLSEELKMKALNLICTLASLKAKTLEKNDVLGGILTTLFQVMSLPPTVEDEDEEYFASDSDEDTLLTCASEALDTLALNVKSELLVPPMMDLIQPALSGNDPHRRRAAYLSLGILAQGCEEYIKEKGLASLVEIVYKGTMEQNHVVRNAALFALAQFTEHLQPEISMYSNELMPMMVQLVNNIVTMGCVPPGDGNKSTTSNTGVDRVLYAVDKFAENLEEALGPYVPQLITHLLTLTTEMYPVHTRELAINIIGSIASAVKEGILPYFMEIMNRLNGFLTQEQDADTLCLQIESIDTLGSLARALGPVHFRPLARDTIDLGMRLLGSTEDPDIKKSVYGLFASVSTVLKEEMAPVLPTLIEHLLKSVTSEEGFIGHVNDDDDEAFPYDSDSEEEEEEGIEKADDSDFSGFGVENDFIEEKEESCFALKELAANTGEAFAPYLQVSFKEVFKLLSFPNEDVKVAAIEAASQILISIGKMSSQSNETFQVFQEELEKLVAKGALMVRVEEEREVVLSVLESLAEVLRELKGLVVLHPRPKDAIVACVKDVVTSRTEAQGWAENGEEDDELVEAAGDLVPALGRAMTHQEFASHFSILLPLFRDRMYNSGEDDADNKRASSIGMLAECMEGLGPCVEAHLGTLLPFLLCLTADPNSNVRNNAIYALGEMAFHGKEPLFRHYPEILNALSKVMPNEQNGKVLDNICGAIARLIMANPSGIPMEQVLPALVGALPLKEDFVENKWIVGAFSSLYSLGDSTLRAHIVPVLKVCTVIVGDKSTEQETRDLGLSLVNMIRRDFPCEFQAVASQLPQEALGNLEKACSDK